MQEKNYTVTIGGFKTRQAAEEFMSWYEGQGEQDIGYWMEERESEKRIKYKNNFTVDMKSFDLENLTMNLK